MHAGAPGDMSDEPLSTAHAISLAGVLDEARRFAKMAARRLAESETAGEQAFSHRERDEILARLGALGEVASALFGRYGLSIPRPSLRGELRGHSSILWANLMDSLSDAMKRYGPPPEWYSREIDPELRKLAEIAHEILYLSREPERTE